MTEYNPWTGEYEAVETEPAVEPAVTPDPLATIGTPPTPVPVEGPSQTATAAEAQPVLDPINANPVTKAIKATGQALAQPVINPKGFVEGLNEQVKGVFVDPFVQAVKNPEDIGKQFDPRLLHRDTPGFSLVPGYATAHDVQTPQGREQLKEHPEQVALDVLGLIPSGAASKLAKGAPSAAAKVGETLAKTSPGRAVAEKVSGLTAKAREVLPSARAGEVAALPTAQRAAAQEVSRNYGSTLEALQKADLDEAQTAALRESLDRGMRPADETLGPLYDQVKAHSEFDRQRKLERDIPDELKSVVVDQVEATLGPKMAATGLGNERTAAMFEALRKGADNPFPEASKAWNQMRLETNRRVLTRQRDAKLFEFDAGIPGVEPQVYPWRDFSKLRAAKHQLARGKITPEAYRGVVDKITPGKYEPMLQAQKTELALAANRQRFEPGFGRGAYDQMTRESMTTWTELAEQGVNPVYVPREALRTLTDEAKSAGPRVTTAKPSSLKKSGGASEFFETDPALMFLKNEYDLANQSTVQKAIAEVYRGTGGKPWDRALQNYLDQGYGRAQAERMVRNNYLGFKLDGTTTKPAPGMLLVRRDVGAALKTYVEKTMPSLVDEMFGMWMVPTLWLAPMFHVNNVAGGVLMVGLKSPGSLLDFAAYGPTAWKMVREGNMDARIPFGAGMAPQYARKFTRESRIAEGGRLAKLWEKVPGHGAVDKSRKFNEFMDSINRTVVALSEEAKALGKGIDPWTAREMAGKEAANLMQNWDSFSPIERMIVQRLYPFWGFRKAMLRTVLTYPMDHPFRMHFLYQLSRDQQERNELPEEWEHLVAISGVDEKGDQRMLSIKALDPFADISDFFSMKGFLQNLHPLASTPLKGFGVDTFRGGSPFFPDYSKPPGVDAQTGGMYKPFDHSVWWDMVPQIGALARWQGWKYVPPPEEDTPEGWMAWLDKYGSMLRLTPGISVRNAEDAEKRFRDNLKSAARIEAKARAEREKQPATVGAAPGPSSAPTPAPSTPAPSSGTTYNPWTGEYE